MRQTVTLEQLVQVWQQVLRDPRVDAGTSFLGEDGGSITAVRLRAGLRDTLGLEVGFEDLFENDTPEFLWESMQDG